MIKSWRWIDRTPPTRIKRCEGKWELIDGREFVRATVWQNDENRYTWHTWHTWDDHGTGGENSETTALDEAKWHCVAAIVRQGWAPGGWKVNW